MFVVCPFFGFSQIGIGTVTPTAALDITNTTDGLLVPRVALAATNIVTITTPTESELVYNTFTSAAGPNQVTPGYYYLDPATTTWIRVATGIANSWTLTGNSGTSAGTNFIGTTDGQDLRIKTGVGGVNRWNISDGNNGQLQSYSLGTAALPAYSFQADQDTGIFSPVADFLGASTNGSERLRIESDGDVGIATTSPGNRLHVVNNADGQGVLRVDNGTAGGFSGVYFFQGASYRGHIGYVNTGGASGFGGKGYYQLASGDRPIIFSTNSGAELYLERMIIAQDGRVGINTNPLNASVTIQPTSTLQVNGSLGVGTVRVTIGNGGNYVVPGDISKVIINTANGGAAGTVTLPDPATCTGRMISVTRGDANTKVINIQGAVGQIQASTAILGATTTVPVAGINIIYWSDGTAWYR